jgi:hypothetical protein
VFKSSSAGIVYVTAFPNRSVMARYLSVIAWETEVWVADAPSQLIHFNGKDSSFFLQISFRPLPITITDSDEVRDLLLLLLM